MDVSVDGAVSNGARPLWASRSSTGRLFLGANGSAERWGSMPLEALVARDGSLAVVARDLPHGATWTRETPDHPWKPA